MTRDRSRSCLVVDVSYIAHVGREVRIMPNYNWTEKERIDYLCQVLGDMRSLITDMQQIDRWLEKLIEGLVEALPAKQG